MQLPDILSTLVYESGIACGPDVMRAIENVRIPDSDRRKRVRMPLTWTIYLLRSTDTHPLEGKTKNISSDGFYCSVGEPFVVGESVRCTLFIPACDLERKDHFLFLECRATVLRVEFIAAENYGVACRIDDYKVVKPSRTPERMYAMYRS